MPYDEAETWLARGESLLLYSDGILEVHNAQREMYGLERLRARLANNPSQVGLIQDILEGLDEFTGEGWEQEDDITCLVLTRQPDVLNSQEM